MTSPLRDTATLLELLEAEQEWLGSERNKAYNATHGAGRFVVLSDKLRAVQELLRFYREEASRVTLRHH